jgi:hypothetical protein
MNGVIPPLSVCAFIAWAETNKRLSGRRRRRRRRRKS